MRDDQEYPAGQLTVKGITVEIWTTGQGKWITRLQGVKIEAETRDKLKQALARAIRAQHVTVEVPFVATEGRSHGGSRTVVKRGTATGVHAGSRNVLVAWADGPRGQLSGFSSDTVLDGETDPEEWQRLLDAELEASRALAAYVKAHKLASLYKLVTDAVHAVAADEQAKEVGSDAE